MEANNQFDVCIIGAGVAGGTLAAYLGKHNIRVALIEKTITPQDRIVGELLQPGGVIKLREMGLSHLLDGFDAQPVNGYALFLNGKHFKINYPGAETGRGFRNGRFVQKIRDEVFSLSTVQVFEGTVTELIQSNKRVTGVKYSDAKTKELKHISAPLTVVSDGIFSGFRQNLCNNKKKVSGYFLGMILKNCSLPYTGCGHVIVAKPSPCLVYPVSSTEARVLIDFKGTEPPKRGAELSNYLKYVIGSQLPAQIKSSYLAAVEEGKFKAMPNHLFPANPKKQAGVVLLGDSLNMRHPLTGGGMTVALSDTHLLGSKLIEVFATDGQLNLENTKVVVKQFYAQRHKQAATVNILADALYGVMSNEDLKTACYNYLQRGGSFSAEPISILSAVSRDVNLLMRHFVAVAVYGAKQLLLPFPTAKRIYRSFHMLTSAIKIITPLIINERPGNMARRAMRAALFMF